MIRNPIVCFTFCLLVISSCYKDDPNYNPYTIVQEVERSDESVNMSTQAFNSVVILKELLSQVILGAMLEPGLWNLQNNTALTRTGCVTSSLSNASGTFPNTLSLVFDSGAACTGANDDVINADIDGTLTALVNAQILTEAATGREITITLTPNFQIFGYQINVAGAGEIHLEFSSGGYLIYLPNNVEITDATGTATNGFTTTYIGRGNSSHGKVTTSGGTVADDPDNPITYIDNSFGLVLNEIEVHCTNTNNNTTEFCLDVPSEANQLDFQPFACGCITDGRLRIRDISGGGDCSSSAVNSDTNADRYDFGYDSGGNNNEACDNVVRKTLAGEITANSTFPTMSSCTP